MSTAMYLAKGLGSKETAWKESYQDPNLWCQIQSESGRDRPTRNCKIISWRIPTSQSNCSKWRLCRWLLVRQKNVEKALERVDELELVLNRGGFTLKGITFTGSDPQSALSTDDSSVNVAGIKRFSKKDL